MKKKNKLNFVIPLSVYPFDVMVSIGETNDEVTKRLKSLGLNDDSIEAAMINNDTIKARAAMFSNNASMIRLVEYPVYNGDFAILVHEIFHVVTFIMERIGMRFEVGVSCEAYAYLMQYITKQIYDRL